MRAVVEQGALKFNQLLIDIFQISFSQSLDLNVHYFPNLLSSSVASQTMVRRFSKQEIEVIVSTQSRFRLWYIIFVLRQIV